MLHPTAPLFDLERQSLKPRCKNALRRVFTLCDRDMDGALSDEELNEFQVTFSCLSSCVWPPTENSFFPSFLLSIRSFSGTFSLFLWSWHLSTIKQVKCFNAPLQPAEIVGVKRIVQENLPSGVNDRGLTLPGFLFLHALFIEKGRLETTWAVLRKFGYDDDLNLSGDYLPVPSKQAPDQVTSIFFTCFK